MLKNEHSLEKSASTQPRTSLPSASWQNLANFAAKIRAGRAGSGGMEAGWAASGWAKKEREFTD